MSDDERRRPCNRRGRGTGKPTLTPVEAILNYGRKVRDRYEKRSGGEDVTRGPTMGVNGALSWSIEGIVASGRLRCEEDLKVAREKSQFFQPGSQRPATGHRPQGSQAAFGRFGGWLMAACGSRMVRTATHSRWTKAQSLQYDNHVNAWPNVVPCLACSMPGSIHHVR